MASIDFFRCLIAGEHLVFVRQKKEKQKTSTSQKISLSEFCVGKNNQADL